MNYKSIGEFAFALLSRDLELESLDHLKPAMTYRKSQVSLRTAIVTMAILSLALAVASFCIRRAALSQSSKRNLGSICSRMNGHFSIDLVDGDICIDLAKTDISMADAAEIKSCYELCIDDLGLRCNVQIDLSHAHVRADEALAMIGDQVISLKADGLPIDDEAIFTIASKCPRLRELWLDNTEVTDRSIPIIARLPLQILHIRAAGISQSGYDELRSRRTFLHVESRFSETDDAGIP